MVTPRSSWTLDTTKVEKGNAMLLLVTNRRDITMDYVVAELRRREVPYFRLNTELLPQSICTMTSYPRSAGSIRLGDEVIHGDQVSAAYFRRPGAPIVSESVADPGERAYIEAEWSSFLKSIYSRLSNAWLNSPANIFAAEDKPLQLMLAREIGFNVPKVAIKNDIASVRELCQAGGAIGKPLRQAVLAGESERVIFTTRLGALGEVYPMLLSITEKSF